MTDSPRDASCSMREAVVEDTEVITSRPKRLVRERLQMPDGYRCDWCYVDTHPQ